MKKSLLFLTASIGFLLHTSSLATAQGVGVNSSGSPADPSAIFDASSTEKGALIPRMTTAQRDAIVSPAIGLLIYNTTTSCINLWLGSSWKKICGDCDFTNPVPGNNGPICENGTLNLTSTSVGVGATYQWSGPNGFVSTEQNPSILNATAAASGSYSVVATLNGCAAAAQSTVATVNAIPQTPVASNNGPLCIGNTLNLNSTTITSASYTWTGPNSFTANTQNSTLANAQTINSGTYSVIALVAGCNSAAGTTTVVVNETPATPGTISGAASVTSYSSGNVYSISAVSGATTYNWTVPSGASITAGAGTISITVTFGGIGSGSITVSASNTCGTSSANSKSITINPTVVSFTNVGTTTWTAPSFVNSVQYLVIAGGGGAYNSGGGAGGFLTGTMSVTPSGNYTVTVGAGGAPYGNNGSNSVFGPITAIGGGGGANNTAGGSGGSGGGAGWNGTRTGGSGTGGQGNAGGNVNNITNDPYPTGGGGGAGGVGGNASPTKAGDGGAGLPSNITGSTVYYAGGGGGGLYPTGTPGTGGIGGGGNGCAGGCTGSSGAPNTGGGGGGASGDQSGVGGSGGSGIVIISY